MTTRDNRSTPRLSYQSASRGLLLLLCGLLTGCVVEQRPSWNVATATSSVQRRAWAVKPYDRVVVWGELHVVVMQGPLDSVRVAGGLEELDNYGLRQEGNTLFLNPMTPTHTPDGQTRLCVILRTPELRHLEVNGDAGVTLADSIAGDSLNVALKGWGMLILGKGSHWQRLTAQVNGAATIVGEPRADLLQLDISGGTYTSLFLDSCQHTEAAVNGAAQLHLQGHTQRFSLNQSGLNYIHLDSLQIGTNPGLDNSNND